MAPTPTPEVITEEIYSPAALRAFLWCSQQYKDGIRVEHWRDQASVGWFTVRPHAHRSTHAAHKPIFVVSTTGRVWWSTDGRDHHREVRDADYELDV